MPDARSEAEPSGQPELDVTVEFHWVSRESVDEFFDDGAELVEDRRVLTVAKNLDDHTPEHDHLLLFHTSGSHRWCADSDS